MQQISLLSFFLLFASCTAGYTGIQEVSDALRLHFEKKSHRSLQESSDTTSEQASCSDTGESTAECCASAATNDVCCTGNSAGDLQCWVGGVDNRLHFNMTKCGGTQCQTCTVSLNEESCGPCETCPDGSVQYDCFGKVFYYC